MEKLKAVQFTAKIIGSSDVVIGSLELVDILDTNNGQKTLIITNDEGRHLVHTDTIELVASSEYDRGYDAGYLKGMQEQSEDDERVIDKLKEQL